LRTSSNDFYKLSSDFRFVSDEETNAAARMTGQGDGKKVGAREKQILSPTIV
jgi:hypothetical protein